MKKLLFLRILITLAVVVLALFVGREMWRHYEEEPWTRDGRVRADVVQISPDVSGIVTDVLVRDNQFVKAGQPLFLIDRDRYRLALARSETAIRAEQVLLSQAEREARRNHELGELVSGELREQGDAKVDQIRATLAQAMVERETAKLNLERTAIRATVDGMVSNFGMRPGDYAAAGRPEFAIIDSRSLHVIGYFEETKLPRIHVGDPVAVRLMGETATIDGHVQSIAGGIEDRERQPGSSLLANVNPVFSWVRLAQRIPVRVAIDRVPDGMRLIAGRTATVEVLPAARQTAPVRIEKQVVTERKVAGR